MDHCVPDLTELSPPQSPSTLHKQSPQQLKTREIKSPAKLQNGEHRRYKLSGSPTASPRVLSTRPSPSTSEDDDDEHMLITAKRRKLNYDTPSYTPSPCGSPCLTDSTLNLLSGDTSFDDVSSQLFADNHGDQLNGTDTSTASSPAISPSLSTHTFQSANLTKGACFRGRYKKDELWPAIEGNYQFLMDEEIIETCKSTESDLSWESDDVTGNGTTVSFNEFQQQYKELTDWLTHIQGVTQRESSSLSEKYLNQTYHEEMLHCSPRRKFFNDYAKQLMRRYPQRKDEVLLRLHNLNKQWEALDSAISPNGGYMEEHAMLLDLEKDLNGLRKWLQEIEDHLQPLVLSADWTTSQLQNQLQQHQVLQKDLAAHSKIVSPILKLCERLHNTGSLTTSGGAADKKLLADNLERRWHAILLHALEWQCQLEEAIKNGIKKRPVIECPSSPESDDNQSAYTSYTSDQSAVYYTASRHATSGDCDILDDGVESDGSNFDVIPFSESEYEKITVDTDVQTDDNPTDTDDKGVRSSSVVIPFKQRDDGERCEGMEHCGTDSALGRSVSDHSINTENRHNICHSSIKLSHDKFKQAVNKAVASRDHLTMRAAQEAMVVPAGSPQDPSHRPLSLKVESHDIGYSSESHSNEEPEYLRYTEINGNTPSPDDESVQNANLRVTNSTKPQNNTWRHSMTSAYDTSSNCSDHNNSPDDQDVCADHVQDTLDPDVATPEKMQTLLYSPSRSFYQMTTIETDSEATSTADRHMVEDTRSGAGTDAESLDLPYDDTPVRFSNDAALSPGAVTMSAARVRLDAVFENIEPLDTPIGSPDSPSQVVPVGRVLSDGDQSMDEEYGHNMADSGESNALFDMESMGRCRPRNVHDQYTDVTTKDRDCVSRLLQQAKLLAQDSQYKDVHPPSSYDNEGVVKKKKHKSKRTPKRYLAHDQSFTSTDGSALPTDDSVPSAQSMCEASCEDTSESSESDGELSSTSSSEGEEHNLTNSILSASKSIDNTLCSSPSHNRFLLGSSSSAFEGRSVLMCRTHSKAHLFSALSDNDLDNAKYSVSESAINDLRRQRHHQVEPMLRRSASDLPRFSSPRQSTPRHIRRRRLRKGTTEGSISKLCSPMKLTYSQSLPTSRRHSSRSHSRSLSPASLQLLEAMSSADESTLLYRDLTHTADTAHGTAVPVAVHHDTDDDLLQHSLTSAAEFSENAWDNLHHIYPTMSSDPGEEKLDASEFHKDWDFHNNYNSDQLAPSGGDDKNASVVPHVVEKSKQRSKDKRISSTKLSATHSYDEDSDSDLEEIHYVIDDSRKAIKFTENTLRKFRKDNMETGIFIDPSEYDGPLETCKEHIVCLEEIRNILEMNTAPNSDQDEIREIREINDMVSKWQSLGGLAAERQRQSACLSNIYHNMISVKSSLQEITEDLEKDCFDSVTDLEHSIKIVQESKMKLHHQHEQKMAALVDSLADFEDRYPDLKMARFDEEVTLLQHRLQAAMEKSSSRAAELQAILLSWYDFGETKRELEYLLGREQRQLSCMEGTEEIMTNLFSVDDINCTIHDLKALDAELGHYEKKLQTMHSSQTEIAKVYSQTAHKEIRTNLEALEETFKLLRSNCRTMAENIQTRLEKSDKQTQVAVSMESAIDARLSTIADMDSLSDGSSRCSMLWRLLKVALPIHIAVVVGFSLLCLYDPSYYDVITKSGLIFSPHLAYVDGPPPI